MSLSRRVQEHRPALILSILVLLCLTSLVTGTESTVVHRAVQRLTTLTAYPFLRAGYALEDGVAYVFDLVIEYDAIRKENEALKHQNSQLFVDLNRRNELYAENQRLRSMLEFERQEPLYSLLPARVIQSYKGTLVIDRGTYHGVEPAMGVMAPDGMVGLIIDADYFTSKVATLHHPDGKVGAMVRRNRLRAYDGVVHAWGSDFRLICTMEYIDQTDDVRQGDLVVTSPESHFPSNIPIGTISRVFESDSLWKRAEVDPAVDPYSLDEVFIIQRAAPAPADLTAAPTSDSAAPELPDERSLQERWAP